MQLTQEQQFFIKILKDYLLEKPSCVRQERVDWQQIKSYADRHQVTAIFYRQTKQKVFQQAYASQIYRYMNFEQEICAFKDALKAYRYLMVKGAVVASLYQNPELRSMGDADILIHPEDREDIHSTLLKAGFEFRKSSSSGEWEYLKSGFLFEVHDSLVHRYKGKENLVEYFSHAWDYEENGQLNWSFHLIYLIEHLRQHFVGEGVGFRQFMDVAIVCRKCEIDWKFVTGELKKIGLDEFASTVFAFIESWFDIAVPFKAVILSEDFYIRATEKIFADGVFGFDNGENRETALSFSMHYKGLDFKTARKQYLLGKLFPDYEAMCCLPYCNYVKKSKIFLPVAWMHRIIYRAFNRKSRSLMKQQLSGDKVMARMDMMREWGLEKRYGKKSQEIEMERKRK